MPEDMTVIHMHTDVRTERHSDLDTFARPDEDRILPSAPEFSN